MNEYNMQTIVKATSLVVTIGASINAVLRIDGGNSARLLDEYFRYHEDEFNKDKLMGLILVSAWLKTRGVKYELKAGEGCGLVTKYRTRLCLHLAQLVHDHPVIPQL